MALTGDPGGWFVSDLAAIEKRIARGNPSSAEERARLEQRLREAQTLDATGRLAAGVAHAFNNLLTVMVSGCDLLRADMRSERSHALLEDMMRAAARGATLTRQLLAVGGRQVIGHAVLDVNEIVSGLEEPLRGLVGSRITLVLVLDQALPKIEGDRAQIEDALLNLVANARDAIPDGGGSVTIKTFLAPPLTETRSDLDSSPGPRVSLAVSDTGPGMDDYTKAHLFEPFFTTKSPETGAGLGLAMVYGIVHQHGGALSVDSAPGRGATFTISLPPATMAETGRVSRTPIAERTGACTETILLVDDEAIVRAMMSLALGRKGYTVLEAANGLDALGVFERYSGTIDLLLTDVAMPGLNGRELFENLASRRSGLKVLFVSGYAGDTFQVPPEQEVPFLPKPFLLEALLQKVREVLDRV